MDNQIINLEGLQLQSLNKEAMVSQSLLIKDNINDGYLDPLDVLISAKKMQELGKQLEEVSRPIAEDKVRLQRGEVYKTQSVEVVEKTIGSRTDYSNCNDEVWERLQQDLCELKELIKQRENFLNALTGETTIVTSYGEVVTLNPPIKSGRIGLSLTIK